MKICVVELVSKVPKMRTIGEFLVLLTYAPQLMPALPFALRANDSDQATCPLAICTRTDKAESADGCADVHVSKAQNSPLMRTNAFF